MQTVKTLGPYKLRRETGRGEASVVYEGVDTRIGRTVAVKVLGVPPNLSPEQSEALKRRLQREARAVGRVSHPNVVKVFVVGEQDGVHYLVMEFLDGVTLRDRLADGPLPFGQAANILDQVAAGLEAAHARGVTHRDVKPSNVMVLPDAAVKLTDFGLAYVEDDVSLTSHGGVIGSPSHMSPEQARGESATPASDLWALGVLLYQMLIGRLPFEAQNVPSVLYKIVHEEPTIPPSFPAEVSDILRQALDKTPERRFPSPHALADAFRSTLSESATVPSQSAWTGPPLAVNIPAGGDMVPEPNEAQPHAPRRLIPMWQVAATVIALFALGGASLLASHNSVRGLGSRDTLVYKSASDSLPELDASAASPLSSPPPPRIAPPSPAAPRHGRLRVSLRPQTVVAVKPILPSPTPTPVLRLSRRHRAASQGATVVVAEPQTAPTGQATPTPQPASNLGTTEMGSGQQTVVRTNSQVIAAMPTPVTTPAPRPMPTRTAETVASPAPEVSRPVPPDANHTVPVVEVGKATSGPPEGAVVPSRDDTDAELRDLLKMWIAATNARDIGEQIGFYPASLESYYGNRNVSRRAVRTDKERVFGDASQVETNASGTEIAISPDGQRAEMRFQKRYLIRGGHGTRRGTVTQELRWRLIGDGWKIVSECDLQASR